MARASARRVERSAADPAVAPRIDALDWSAMAAALDERGYATTGPLLDPDACADLIALYADASRFRSRVVMQRHAFGRGEYQYFAYPLPPAVADLRHALYPHLAPLANRWNEQLQSDVRFPA